MMDNAIPRLMWYISAIPLYELPRFYFMSRSGIIGSDDDG